MAEESSHNVVNQPESTNGSAPFVDLAENHNITASAVNGTSSTTVSESLLPPFDGQSSNLAERASKAEAEPSAGNAAPHLSADASIDQSADNLLDPELTEDRATQDVSADPSVTSDNDNQFSKDGQHNRTNSVKKPPTFSRVSVTKNFMAKSVTPPVAAKSTDKSVPVAVAQPAALRPRLVAKTAASLSNLARTKPGSDSNTGPDASKVWNKNRPAPAMPPKQFTDEELKQQYGIHMATRLQSDEGGKGAKWADIDDDEDDWAPEAVVWMDGTKSTLTTAENAPAVAEVQTTAPVAAASDTPKPSLVLGRKSSQTPMITKTILKPGAASQAKQQTGATPTTAAEKAVLVAKSPAPTPAKSPWATLPPVETISPINPPVQVQSQPRLPFPSQDARAGDPSIVSNHPAREIAADTFDRSWPSVEGETRELFNSNNGRYEPAPEGRRNSIRFDRKQAVLRRPSHGMSSGEPPNIHNVPWSHRRGSSVSQNSSSIQRPMSVAQSVDSHGVLSASSGPDRDANHPLASAGSAWAQQLPPMPTGPAPEEPVKAQERIMREKREAARLRRQEEEAQEEAAKQARLKAKLDALAGVGLSRKERQQASTASDAIQQPSESVQDETSQPAQAQSPVQTTSEPVVQPQPLDTQVKSPVVQQAAIAEPSPRLTQREQLASSAASRTTFQSQVSGSYQTAPSSAFSSPGDRERKPQPFGRSALQNHDSLASPWASSGVANVWGVKGIGNGTFESAFAPITSHHGLTPLPPLGMGRPATASRISPQSLDSASHSPDLPDLPDSTTQVDIDPHQSLTTPDLDLVPDHFKHHTSIPNQSMGRTQPDPGPIAPPRRPHQAQSAREQIAAWQSVAQQGPSQYRQAAQKQFDDILNGETRPRMNISFKETFRQTGSNNPAVVSRYDNMNSNGNAPIPPSTQTQTLQPAGHLAGESNVRLPDAAALPPHLRRAAVQPPHYKNKVAFTTAPLAPGPQASDDIPPPPEISSHPVFDGDHYRPNVRLPPPPAVVKLPPALAGSNSAQMLSQRVNQNFGNLGGARPLVQNEAWQARFNGLFNRTPIHTETPPSPPKTPPKPLAVAPALAIASSSRAFMDESMAGPTVSLPRSAPGNASVEGFTVDHSKEVTSKTMAQNMFKEELGFGSRPHVRIPRNVQRGNIEMSRVNLLNIRSHSKDPNNVDPYSKVDGTISYRFFKKPEGYLVKLPGSTHNKMIYTDRNHKTKPVKARSILPAKKQTVKQVDGTATDAKITAPATTPSSRKTSTPKSGIASGSSESTPANKVETTASKNNRKRSGHVKHGMKATVAATEKATSAVKAA